MSVRDEREPLPPKPRGYVAGQPVKLEGGDVRSETGGGWTATEVLTTEKRLPDEAASAGGMSASEAVKADRDERGAVGPSHQEGVQLTALGQPFAIFHHPSEFTQEEEEVIVNGLLANLPLYMIAARLHCSRNLLSKHIKESKLLSEVWADAQESFIDNVEWQAKRLIDSGNAAMIMFALERKGKDRGWGQEPIKEVDLDDTRIVIGEIPAEEVEAAKEKVKELEKEAGVVEGASIPPDGTEGEGQTLQGSQQTRSAETEKAAKPAQVQKIPSPMEMALMEDAAKAAAKAAMDEGTINIPPEDVHVEPAPWDDGFAGGDPFDGGGFTGFM